MKLLLQWINLALLPLSSSQNCSDTAAAADLAVVVVDTVAGDGGGCGGLVLKCRCSFPTLLYTVAAPEIACFELLCSVTSQ